MTPTSFDDARRRDHVLLLVLVSLPLAIALTAVALEVNQTITHTLTLEDCARTCDPAGVSVFEADRACYCDTIGDCSNE